MGAFGELLQEHFGGTIHDVSTWDRKQSKTNNMTDITTEKKPRAKRTVRSSEVVTKSALALPLAARVELMKTLEASVQAEVDGLKAAATQAEQIMLNGS